MKAKERKKLLKERLEKYKPELTDNIIPLHNSDFDEDGTFLASSYSDVKNLTEHLDRDMKLKITVPEKHMEKFSSQLDKFITLEIITLEKEISKMRQKAIVMLSISMTIAVIYGLMSDVFWLYDMSIVAFYVFTWGAIDRFVFYLPDLRRKEDWLLQIANSEIEVCQEKNYVE